jgi:hypothetical protein
MQLGIKLGWNPYRPCATPPHHSPGSGGGGGGIANHPCQYQKRFVVVDVAFGEVRRHALEQQRVRTHARQPDAAWHAWEGLLRTECVRSWPALLAGSVI